MDKITAKYIYKTMDIPCADFLHFQSNEYKENPDKIITEIEQKFNYPVFVKPSDSGSSIGVAKTNNRGELVNAIEVAAAFSTRVLIEEAITEAKEINISVMGIAGVETQVSVCEEVFSKESFLSYNEKYVGEGSKSKGMASTKRKIPAQISDEVRNRIEELAKKTFNALALHGLVRIDFLYKEKTNELFLIEPNTTPGSMAFYLWEAGNLPFSNLIDRLIELAIKRHALENNKITTISSNILTNFNPGLKNSKLG
jgi:D-alanine-D-alanine ligase